MSPEAIPTWFIVLVIVREDKHFLAIRETKLNQVWYVPAGRVEIGESLTDAAVRETLEEAGIPVILDGIIRIEHTLYAGQAWVRVVFTAHPADDTPPKSQADEESLEARWVSIQEARQLPARGDDMVQYFQYILDGGAVYPLSILSYEGAPLD